MPRKNRGPYLDTSPDGYYEIRWTDAGRSRRRSTRTRDFQQAQKVLANFILLGEREALVANDDGPITVGECLAAYLQEHVDAKVAGKETANFAVAKLVQYFGPMAPRDILPSHVREFIAQRRKGRIGKPSGDATINRDLTVLTAALNHAVKAKRLTPSDMPTIEKLPPPPAKDRWLTHDEAARLFAAARLTWDWKKAEWITPAKLPRVYKFIALALGTASRKTALLELRRDQVDLERRMIYLNPPGRRQTKKRRPPVPISDDLLPIMQSIVDEADTALLLGPGSIRTAFESAVKRAGLKGVTPHTLRHTWATWAAQGGVPLTDIAGVLGDTYATVERNYLHHCPEHLRGAVNSVGLRA